MNLQNRVLIVGGGPAGLAASLALCSTGFRVTVIDPGHPPIEKVCGEGLLPEALVILRRLGVLLSPEQGFPFPGIRYCGYNDAVHAEFPQGFGLGMRRIVLHQRLIEAAEKNCVKFLWGRRVDRISRDGAYVNGELVHSDWIIGADGSGSRVRKWIGTAPLAPPQRRFAFRKHYRMPPWSEYMEVRWGRTGQFYVTPLSSSELCVVMLSRRSTVRLQQALQEVPELATFLSKAESSGREQGAVTQNEFYSEVYRGNVALVGDASGTVDAITGEGLRLAFQQAEALAAALAQRNLALYGQAHRELVRRPARMARLLLAMDGRPWLQRRVLRALASQPDLFSALLAAHVGQATTQRTAAAGLRLGWKMLTA
jgi:flavin-dependent dehydrogenase